METKVTIKDFLSEVEDKLSQEAIDLIERKSDACYFRNAEELMNIEYEWDRLRIKKDFLNQLWEMAEEIEGE
jgi:hypothetical protein